MDGEMGINTMCTEIIYLSTSINDSTRERKDENSPFRWKFDAFQFGVLHSDRDDILATGLLHDENAIANCT